MEIEMAANRSARAAKVKDGGTPPRRKVVSTTGGDRTVAAGPAAALEEARRSGLLDGDKTEHVSFRAPPALVEAAKRESGVASPTDLGILALAMLAQPDPAAAFMKRTRGRLGPAHALDY
jgi:hypothetical protein